MAAPAAAEKQRLLKAYARLPLAFVPNAGQLAAKRVRYYARGPGYGFYATPGELVLGFRKQERAAALALRFLGASPGVRLEGDLRLPGRMNYLLGNDPAKWRTELPSYGQVVYRGLWPGVDMVVGGGAGTLKYAFRLRPGARPEAIRLAYRGAKRLSLSPAGGMLIETPLGTLRDARPVSYQQVGGRRVEIPTRLLLDRKRGRVGFALGAGYDPASPLLLDPGLAYSTYLGGSGFDEGLGIALDREGSAYVTGDTHSGDFPTTLGAFDTSNNGGFDAFVAKLELPNGD